MHFCAAKHANVAWKHYSLSVEASFLWCDENIFIPYLLTVLTEIFFGSIEALFLCSMVAFQLIVSIF